VGRALERGGAPPLGGRAARAPRPLHQRRRRQHWPVEQAATSRQGCSSFRPLKQEPINDEEDYAAAMYRRLGLGHGGY
jgi:hypothetical protein